MSALFDDSNYIDEKKGIQVIKQFDEDNNITGYLSTIVTIICLSVVYFSLSGSVLYMCKVGASNIVKNAPYTSDNKYTENNIKIFGNQNISFPYNDENKSNFLMELDVEKSCSQKSDDDKGIECNIVSLFFRTILKSLSEFNYKYLNLFFRGLNWLPEPLIILFGPILLTIVHSFFFICDNFYLLFLWFYGMFQFTKFDIGGFTNLNWRVKKITRDFPPELNNITGPILNTGVNAANTYGSGIGAIVLICIFTLIYILTAGWLLPLIISLLLTLNLFTFLTYMCTFNKMPKEYVTRIILNVFKNHKLLILFISGYFITTNTYNQFGTVPGILSVILILVGMTL